MPVSDITPTQPIPNQVNLKTERAGMIYIILAGCLWGLGGVIGQYLLQDKGISASWLIGIRMWLPGSILLALCYRKRKKAIFLPWKNKSESFRLIIFAVFGMMASQLSYFLAIQYSNAATATILQYLYPVVIAIILSVYLKKRPSIYLIISIVLALTGAFCLVTDGSISAITLPLKAIIFGGICIIASVTYTLYPIPLLQKYNTATIAGWGMLVGGIVLNFFHPFWKVTGTIDMLALLGLLFVIFGAGMAAFLLYLVGVKLIGSTKGSVLATVEPLSAALFSVVLLNVKFSVTDWIGTACIIAMIVVLAKSKV
ncbi:DMT family transporter [Commensalibacter oyaizuii]|uniref:EamA family transporter n=1 Tax=Commensalibacter oyaizuii TaxID=3043873 RepID=A0ABT6PZL9_9PROT|nr:EamA family transporter [Commensalibacter sp. TBRC 16381]MDI2089951.1 EamA family transporter [Commensalibacter sp. TBRC 16381]